MSTATTTAGPAGPAGPAPSSAPDRRRRPRRSTALVLVALVVAVVVVALGTRSVTRDAALDPDNPAPGGAQALARVLADEGVEVDVVRDADALADAEVDAGTTVVVTSTELLGPTTTGRLLTDAADGRVVLTAPGTTVLDELDVDAPTPADVSAPLSADCDADGPDGADGPDLSDLELEVDYADAYPLGGCFGTPDGAVLATAQPGVLLLGAEQLLANEAVLRADNAAVALRLLGAGDRLVWYVPDPDDLGAEEGDSLASLLPPWLVPSLWLLFGTSLVAIWWRARRFGPLAVEPLPVSVKATETTRSRGRLYHRARDRGHAADTLRHATRDRIATRLGAPAAVPAASPTTAAVDPLVDEVARRTGRHPGEVAWLLTPGGEPPGSDADLITLADGLAELDREVRRT